MTEPSKLAAKSPRRVHVAMLALGVLLVLAVLGSLNAFNLRFLTPQTTAQILVFTGLSVVVFLLLLVLLVLLIRNIAKLYADQQSRALGSRLRTRMVVGAALIALAPAVFMFLFSFLLMNRNIERWFSQPTSELREDSLRVALELAHYAASNARIEAGEIATSGQADGAPEWIARSLAARRIALDGGFAAVYRPTRELLTGYQLPGAGSKLRLLPWLDDEPAASPELTGPVAANLLAIAQRADEPLLAVDARQYALGAASSPGGNLVVVALPMPDGLSQTAGRIRTGADEYWTMYRSRNRIRNTYFLMLLLITALVFFSSVWLALFLSKQITRPVEALADAMNEIAGGEYEHRVAVPSSGEMADLVASFNRMAADLEASRMMARNSTEQLFAVNQALEQRRRELETLLETIPSGVATIDSEGAILQANRAFSALIGRRDDTPAQGCDLARLLPADSAGELTRLIRRSHRMGAASTEIETHATGRALTLSVTSARLDLEHGKQGAVLVLEDTTEILRAQRQLAWKEVAQRVAHEIKNPLTPIALSAERIRKHLDRPNEDSPLVIRKCSEVILGCVGSLRSLVDQFSALAQFPVPQPRLSDINQIVEEALLLFSGRFDDIAVRKNLDPGLPPVLVDPQAIKRALANLIDNAAEAMQTSLLRVLSLSSEISEDRTAVEVTVADTGPGLTDEIRERLFLPFYSTKQRGTGLGLSIAAKIAQEHNGSIRAESNSPKGARFLLRIPVRDTGMVDGNNQQNSQQNMLGPVASGQIAAASTEPEPGDRDAESTGPVSASSSETLAAARTAIFKMQLSQP